MRIHRLLIAAALASPAAAQNWQDSFETYAVGSPIEGQGGWMNWLGPGSNTTISVVSNQFARTGTRSVLIDAGSDTIQPFNITSGEWVITAYHYLPSTFVGRTTFILMNTHAVPAGPYNWSQEVHIDQTLDSIIFYGGNSSAPTILSGVTYDSWVELRHEIDLDLDTCDVYYGGQFVYSYAWSLGTWTNGVAEIAAIDLWPATAATTEAYWDDLSVVSVNASIGAPYCNPAANNSTGSPGFMEALGSNVVATNDVTLACGQLPTNQFAFFINSMSQGFVPNPGGSQGNLCLSGAIGRYNATSQILNSGAQGAVSLMINLANTPTPTGPTAITAGSTWNFQCWYRDLNPAPTSNFSSAVTVTFQ